ncbi:MAG: fibronectin type III domain-containing protein [Bacteroidales bacterium]|jgi:hypothetical protein|nr:fibronectin type III domain-containing protein [Bacteroidales bacterium]
MKKLFFLFSMAVFAMQTFAQTPLNEGFETGVFPPENWTTYLVSGQWQWDAFDDEYFAYDGAYLAYADWEEAGGEKWLITPKLSIGSVEDSISFYLMTDFPSSDIVVNVKISTTDVELSSFTTTLSSLTNTALSEDWSRYAYSLSSFVGQEIYIAFQVVENMSYTTIYLDNVQGPNIVLPSCYKPTNLVVNNITTSSCDISWTSLSETASFYIIQYMQDFEDNWSNAITDTATENTFSLSLLLHSTRYKARIQTSCSEEESQWSNEIYFSTPCPSIAQLPYIMNFDNEASYGDNPPNCWTIPYYNENTFVDNYSWNAHSGENYLYSYLTSDDPTIITPSFAEDIHLLAITFWAKAQSSDEKIAIGLISDIGDYSTIEMIDTIELSNQYMEYEVFFNNSTLTGTDRYIVIKPFSLNSYGYFYIDDIVVDYIPSCVRPSDFAANNATLTSVDLSWNSENSSCNIQYMPITESNWDNANMVVALTNPYTLNGLTSSLRYKVRIQASCSEEEESQWTNEISFATLCSPIITLPYFNNFDYEVSESGLIPYCWTRPLSSTSNTYPYVFNDASSAYSGTNSLYFYPSSLSSNTSIVTPPIGEDINLLRVKFMSRASSSGKKIAIGVISSLEDLSTLEMVDTITLSTNYSEYEVAFNLTQLTGEGNHIFIQTLTLNSFTSIYIDDFTIDYISSCLKPTNLSASNTTINSVDLSWSGENTPSWNIQYMPINESNWDNAQMIVALSNPYTLNTLSQGTEYKIRVQANCGSSQSDWTPSIDVATLCDTLSLPFFVETFENVPPTICWTKAGGELPQNGNATLVGNGSWNGSEQEIYFGGGNNASINLWSNTNGWLISPSIFLGTEIALSQVELDVLLSSFGGGLPDLTGDDDIFGIVVSTDNGLTWNRENAILWTNEASSERSLNSLYPMQHIIVPLKDANNNPYQGIVRIALYASSTIYNADNYLYVDNFAINPYNACQNVSGLIVNAFTTNADVSFIENGEATSWEYILTSDMTITNIEELTPNSIDTTHFSITSLSPLTQYNLFIRSLCQGGTYSGWVQVSFSTDALPATIPYLCDFEEETERMAWRKINSPIAGWAFGSAAGNGPTTENLTDSIAIYISSSQGENYGETIYGNVYSYTYRDIDFGQEEGSYLLTYDWKCQGSYPNDGLVVFLLETSTPITATLPSFVYDSSLVFNAGSSSWQNGEIALDNVSGVKRLAFFYKKDYSPNSPASAIDNISISQTSCIRPYNVIASNISTTSATISWNETLADSYIVSYKKEEETIQTNISSISSPLTLTGLTLGMQYMVSVRAICQEDTTTMSNAIYFSTPCQDGAISSFPWVEGFENGLNCFRQEIIEGGSYWTTNTQQNGYAYSGYTAHGGNYFAGMFDETDSDDKTKLISPLLDITSMETPTLEFYHRQKLWNADQDELRVFYRVDENSAWIELMAFTDSITLWRKDSTILINPSATYQIAFEGNAKYGHGVAIDDIRIYDASGAECPPPTSLQVGLSNTSAFLSWMQGEDETSWQVKLGVMGEVIDVPNTSYLFTNLSPNTTYIAYLRANCGTTSSAWQSIEFTTLTFSPIVTTLPPTTINQFYATLNGEYFFVASEPESKGFEYKVLDSENWNIVYDAEGENIFYKNITGLFPDTEYSCRAFIIIEGIGTIYGEEVSFSTPEIIPPIVITGYVTDISAFSAKFSASVVPGTEEIYSRGFELKTSSQIWEEASLLSGQGSYTFTLTYNNLIASESYNVRAYVKTGENGQRITYGGVENFTTENDENNSIVEENINSSLNFIIYPNPAEGETKLIISGINGKIKYSLIDAYGREKNTQTIIVKDNIEQKIDLSNLAKGVYYLKLQGENINCTQKLIVK